MKNIRIKLFLVMLMCFFMWTDIISKDTKSVYMNMKSKIKKNLNLAITVKDSYIKKNMTSAKIVIESLVQILAKYYYIHNNIPTINIDPQIISVKNGKVNLTKLRKLEIIWKTPGSTTNLLVIDAKLQSNIDGNDKLKLFKGYYLSCGVNFFKDSSESNLSFIGFGFNLFTLSKFSLDISLSYNGNINVGFGISYDFSNYFSVGAGSVIGRAGTGFYIGHKVKIF